MASRLRLSSIALFSLAVSCVSGFSARAVTIDWVSVGDPNNAADTTGAPNPAGSVATSFRIMKYESTNQQYADFLNSVAATDTYSLYNPSMGTNARGGITRSGAPGGYAYAVKANMGDKPVNYVSWWDAARVANWLVNGAAGGSSTETGAYTLSGGTTGDAPAVNADASYFVPTENQWYKAAFYKGGGLSAGYWDYATQSDTAPTGVTADAGGAGSAGDTGNFANFDFNADWNTLNGNVTTVATNGGPSAYDAFDLDGNVREWNDLNGAASSSRGIRGGSWDYPVASLSSSGRLLNPPDFESHAIGFRLASVAAVPEPSSWAIAAGGLACAAWTAFRRRTRARRPSGSNTPVGSWLVAIVMGWAPVAVVLLWLAGIVSPSVANAEMLTYSITGGLISGTLGGTPFTSATWTITATADSSAAQFLPENSSTGGPIWAPLWYQTVTPSISITSGSSVLTATLTGTGQWFLESRDYSAFLPNNACAVGFFYSPTAALEDGNGAYIDVVGFNNLQTAGTVSGTSGFDNGYPGIPGFSTSAGTLFIDADTHAVGTFVTAVPEPATFALALAGVCCGGVSMGRRRQRPGSRSPSRACSPR